VAQDIELGPPHRQRFLLEGVRPPAGDEETDEVTGGTDRQLAELEGLGRPVGERALPRQVQQDPDAIPESKPRKGALVDRSVQSFLRR
jgi:hypothetical protein